MYTVNKYVFILRRSGLDNILLVILFENEILFVIESLYVKKDREYLTIC